MSRASVRRTCGQPERWTRGTQEARLPGPDHPDVA